MARTSPQILCLGRDATLLECRCAVLNHNGYEARPATIPGGYHDLRTGNFDLVILAARLAADGDFLAALPAETQTLVLNGLMFPSEMLAAVAERLQGVRQGMTLV